MASLLKKFKSLFSSKEKLEAEQNPVSKNILEGIDDFVWVDENPTPNPERQAYEHTLKEFAFTEKLAHSEMGAYGAPNRQACAVVSIKDPDLNEYIDYRPIPIKTHSTGLVAEVFVPVDPNKSSKICINWTGTHSLGTLLADLEKTPGEKSYRKEELSILQQINQAVSDFSKQTQDKIDLVITGHSLGGALAQLNFHTLQRALAKNICKDQIEAQNYEPSKKFINSEMEYRQELGKKRRDKLRDIPEDCRSSLTADNINSITIGTWNAAGVLKAVESSSNRLADYISQAGVKLKGRFGMVAGDGVQRTGQGTVLSNVTSQQADVKVLKVDKGHGGYYKKVFLGCAGAALGATAMYVFPPIGILGGISLGLLPMLKSTAEAHVTTHFAHEDDIISCELYENNSPTNKKTVNDKLTNKASILQFAPIRYAQKGLYHLMGRYIDKEKPKTEETTITPLQKLNRC